jgi:hypothetical protein
MVHLDKWFYRLRNVEDNYRKSITRSTQAAHSALPRVCCQSKVRKRVLRLPMSGVFSILADLNPAVLSLDTTHFGPHV